MDIFKLGLEMERDRRNRRGVYISQQKLLKAEQRPHYRRCIRRNNLPSWELASVETKKTDGKEVYKAKCKAQQRPD